MLIVYFTWISWFYWLVFACEKVDNTDFATSSPEQFKKFFASFLPSSAALGKRMTDFAHTADLNSWSKSLVGEKMWLHMLFWFFLTSFKKGFFSRQMTRKMKPSMSFLSNYYFWWKFQLHYLYHLEVLRSFPSSFFECSVARLAHDSRHKVLCENKFTHYIYYSMFN